MHSALTVFHQDLHQVINPDFEIETLANDCLFTEGPVWNEAGFYLFSDISANVVYKLVPGRQKEIYIANSGTDNPGDADLKPGQGGSDGLAYDQEGTLLVCRHGSHMLAKWDGNQLVPLATEFKGRPLNSPNDLVVDNQNRIFFSDPPYGLKEAQPNPAKYQQAARVYCYRNGELKNICERYQYPNGVCITPNHQHLYICSTKAFEKFISVYDLATLQFQNVLAEENSDGMKCDQSGNVYLSTKDGILILNSNGQRMGLIAFGSVPANHCFGGVNGKDLFVTARESIFRIKNLLQ